MSAESIFSKFTVSAPPLQAVALLETYSYDISSAAQAAEPPLLTWCYPSLPYDQELRVLLLAEARRIRNDVSLAAAAAASASASTAAEIVSAARKGIFTYSKFRDIWYYCHTRVSEQPNQSSAGDEKSSSSALVAADEKLCHFSVVVCAREFLPEKYDALTRLFADVYASQSDKSQLVTAILHEYLNVMLFERSRDKQKFRAADFEARKAFVKVPLQALLDLVGIEQFLVLWTAMMLKKRILIVGDDVELLQSIIRTLPQLVWHRADAWNSLRPLVPSECWHGNDAIIDDLKSAGAYVVGTLDANARADTKRYDVLLDLGAQQVQPADVAVAEELRITRMHKALATTIKENAQNGPQLLKNLAIKTKEILTMLEELKEKYAAEDGSHLAPEHLRELGQPADVCQLLHSIAICENL